MLLVLAILSTLVSLGASLMMLVLLLAGGANSTQKQIAQIRVFIWSVIAITVLSVGLAIWAMVKARYGLAAAVGIVPAAACAGLLIWMLVTEW